MFSLVFSNLIIMMMQILDSQKKKASSWFIHLRNIIREKFLAIENEYDKNNKHYFDVTTWSREGGGGGEMSIMHGNVFEKVAVNVSTVFGQFSRDFASEIPFAQQNDGKFWASGISLIAHMNSPIVPAVHMNTRMLVTHNHWFGGGTDLTPTYYNESDSLFFHSSLKDACDLHDKSYYENFKNYADKYFYLPNRREPRGIGGIFYDNLNTGNFENDLLFTQEVGKAFVKLYPILVRNNMYKSYTKEQKEYQLLKRGRYVEFNLLYDRGTRFGLCTNGNTEAILASLPPSVKWQ